MMPWIKIFSNIADHPKIKLIRQNAKGDSFTLLWIFLLAEAGKCCNGGALLISDKTPYTPETISKFLGFPLSITKTGLNLLGDLSMIELEDGVIRIKNWSKYQVDLEKLDERRKKDRLRQQAHRNKLKGSSQSESKTTSRDDRPPASRDVTWDNREKTKLIETTTDSVCHLLSGTPFEKVSDNDLACLKKRHGLDRLLLVADVAAEIWRRDRDEIHNPAGYIHTLCENLTVPEWYVPMHTREARIVRQRERQERRAVEDGAMQAAEDAEQKARDVYWESLSEDERLNCHELALEDLPASNHPPDPIILILAKDKAWQMRSPDE